MVSVLSLVLLSACQPKEAESVDDTSSPTELSTTDTALPPGETADTSAPADPYYIVSNASTGAMRTFDLDGNYLGDLVPPDGFLTNSSQIELSPDGEALLVATYSTGTVHQVELETGADLGILEDADFLVGPSIFSYRADGALLVSDFLGGEVYAYDYAAGEWLGAAFESGHLVWPHEVVQVEGDYLVTDYSAGAIVRFDAAGAFVEIVADGPELLGPLGMMLTPDGEELLVVNNYDGVVNRFDPATGEHLGVLFDGTGLRYPEGLTLTPEGDLLIASAQNATILRIDINTGEVLGEFEHVDGDAGTVDVLLVEPG